MHLFQICNHIFTSVCSHPGSLDTPDSVAQHILWLIFSQPVLHSNKKRIGHVQCTHRCFHQKRITNSRKTWSRWSVNTKRSQQMIKAEQQVRWMKQQKGSVSVGTISVEMITDFTWCSFCSKKLHKSITISPEQNFLRTWGFWIDWKRNGDKSPAGVICARLQKSCFGAGTDVTSLFVHTDLTWCRFLFRIC